MSVLWQVRGAPWAAWRHVAGSGPWSPSRSSGALVAALFGPSSPLTAQTTGTDPDFSIELLPPSQTINPGSSVSYYVEVTALNNFSGDITFAAAGLPTGVTASFTATKATSSSGATMKLTTAPTAVLGTYPFTVRATSGALVRTVAGTLSVKQRPGAQVPCRSGRRCD